MKEKKYTSVLLVKEKSTLCTPDFFVTILNIFSGASRPVSFRPVFSFFFCSARCFRPAFPAAPKRGTLGAPGPPALQRSRAPRPAGLRGGAAARRAGLLVPSEESKNGGRKKLAPVRGLR